MHATVATLRPDTLVLAGGGIKGASTLGAVHRLRTAGVLNDVRTVVGTSAGALIGALVATHVDMEKAMDVMCGMGYDPDFNFDTFLKDFGLDSGKSIDGLVAALLHRSYTFEQVRDIHDVTLVVCVTNLSQRKAVYIGPDTHPNMQVALALRMSCAVPLYFKAVKYEGEWYADGSIVDNFPCGWALDTGSVKVLGVSTKATHSIIKSFEAFVAALLEAAASNQPCPRADVLELELPGVAPLNFGVSATDLRRLFDIGVQQADAFVKKRV